MPVDSPPKAQTLVTEQVTEAELAAAKIDPVDNTFISRDQWLAQAGVLKEKEHLIDGLGKVLLTEITGSARAAIQSAQSQGLMSDVKRVDVAAYQRALILAGVADPTSPEGGRLPLFQAADMDRVMGIGSSKIEELVVELEKLSGLGPQAARAEENSSGTPSAAGTS